MRALHVNFAPEPAWKRRALLGAIALSWAFACAASWHTWQEWRTLQAAETALQQAQAKQAEQAAKERALQAELAKPKPYAKDAAEVVRIASFPTDQVLHALEVTLVEGVRVTSIDLNPDAATARVELEFDDAGQLMKYLEQINAGDEKPRWSLLQAKMNKAGPAGSSGTASLSSVWR